MVTEKSQFLPEAERKPSFASSIQQAHAKMKIYIMFQAETSRNIREPDDDQDSSVRMQIISWKPYKENSVKCSVNSTKKWQFEKQSEERKTEVSLARVSVRLCRHGQPWAPEPPGGLFLQALELWACAPYLVHFRTVFVCLGLWGWFVFCSAQ